jgi:hypothetical protein
MNSAKSWNSRPRKWGWDTRWEGRGGGPPFLLHSNVSLSLSTHPTPLEGPEDVAKQRRAATGFTVLALFFSLPFLCYPPPSPPPSPSAAHPRGDTLLFVTRCLSVKGRMSMAAAARQMGLDPSELGDVRSMPLSTLLSVIPAQPFQRKLGPYHVLSLPPPPPPR